MADNWTWTILFHQRANGEVRILVHCQETLPTGDLLCFSLQSPPWREYATLLRNMMANHRDCECIPVFVAVPLEMAKRYPVCGNVTEAFLRQPGNLTYVKKIANQMVCIGYYFGGILTFSNSVCKKDHPCSNVRYIPTVSTVRWTEPHLVDSIIEKHLKPQYDILKMVSVASPGLDTFFETVKTANDSLKRDLTQSNFAYVLLTAGEMHSTLIKEELSYDVENLVSDVGGIAGLFLGVSFLTMVEFLNLMHDLALLFVTKREVDC